MAVKLSSSELPELYAWLEQHLPAAFRVRGELKSHLNGKFPGLDFFVDRWPQPQAVIAIIDPDSEELEFKAFYKNIISLFGLTADAVTSLLKADTRFVDWSETAYFKTIPAEVGPSLVSLLQETAEVDVSRYRLLKATPSDLRPVPVPDGMKISTVTDDTVVDLVNSTWNDCNPRSSSYVRHLARRYHSVLLSTAGGQVAGFMLQTTVGTLGMLYVLPQFRRRGCAKVIVSQLARKVLRDGEEACVLVGTGNVASMNTHLSVGFKPCPLEPYFRIDTVLTK